MITKLPGPPPRRPSPDVTETREVITFVSRWSRGCRIEVRTADHRNMPILRIALEQIFTEPEKTWIRQAVVLQNDRSFHLTKDPVEAFCCVSPEPEVVISKPAQ